MHTNKDGLAAHWKIRVYRKYYVRVFVWGGVEALRKACSVYRDTDGVWGMAHIGTFAHKLSPRKKLCLPKKIGEIHIVDGKYGVGLVAHEIQHIVNYVIDIFGWTLEKHDERIACIAEVMNRDFWTKYGKVFE